MDGRDGLREPGVIRLLFQFAGMGAEPMPLPVRHLHVVAQQQHPLEAEMIGQANSRAAAVAQRVDDARVAR